MDITTFIEKLKTKMAKGYMVGGFVRDKVISEIENKPFTFKDRDYAVTGLTIFEFEELFPEAKKIGTEALIFENGTTRKEKTPVYLLMIDGELSEIALARNEVKIGEGHKGFAFVYDKGATIIDDLKRRDFTMNAMAMDLETEELVDPFNGKSDIENKQIKGIFLEDGIEIIMAEDEIKMLNNEFYLKKNGKILSCKLPQDPLRGIRAGRFAAKLGFIIEEETLRAMQQLEEEIKHLSFSRIYEETKKALVGERPDLFLQTMKDAKLLKEFLPEIDNLEALEQSHNKHPEGNVFIHTKQVALASSVLTKVLIPNDKDSLEKNTISAIYHDVGKLVTQTYNQERSIYQYIRHEEAGVPLVKEFLKRWNIKNWEDHMDTITSRHMIMHHDFENIKANKIASIFSGSTKKKELNETELDEFRQYFITKDKLEENKDLNMLVKGMVEKQKGMNHLLKKVAISFKQEINDKKIKKKDWKNAKLEGKEREFIKSKIMPEATLKRFYFYEKEKGIEENMEIDNFYILCASDALGRLKNTEYMIDIFKDAARIIKINDIHSAKEAEENVLEWKEKYDLTDSYVEDFKQFLKNHAISKEYNLIKKDIESKIDEETLKEVGKKPDDIAFAKFESKRRQEINAIKHIQKIVGDKMEKIK